MRERERENDIFKAVIRRPYIYIMLTNPKCLFTLIYTYDTKCMIIRTLKMRLYHVLKGPTLRLMAADWSLVMSYMYDHICVTMTQRSLLPKTGFLIPAIKI